MNTPRMHRLVSGLVDLAPGWLWKPANLRYVGPHTLHFCFGHEGRRTVEWDGREVAVGGRRRRARSGASGSIATTRVEDHVTGWVQRSYLKRDGWWAQLVLDEFSFLDDLGFSLTGSEWAGIHFHQKGHYVAFVGPRRDVAIEYDPETNTIGADIVDHDPRRFTPLDQLIAQHIPGEEPPQREPLDRETISATVRWWAGGLRRIAPEIL